MFSEAVKNKLSCAAFFFLPGLSYSLVTSRMPAIKVPRLTIYNLASLFSASESRAASDCFSLPDSSVFLKIDQLLPPAPHSVLSDL